MLTRRKLLRIVVLSSLAWLAWVVAALSAAHFVRLLK